MQCRSVQSLVMGGMLELWIVVSFAAACFQTLRFMLQKVLSVQTLSPAGVTFARFCYSAPIIVLAMAFYAPAYGHVLQPPPLAFWVFATTGALAQVLATVAVVTLFKLRNFAVGVTLMKTEVILSALLGFVLLGDGIGAWALCAILIGVAGVLLLSPAPETTHSGWRTLLNRGIALGLGAGLLFAISAVCYRGASLEIDSDDPILRAGLTLAAVTSMQMAGMWLWLRWRDAPQIRAVWQARQRAVWIGITSLAGSFCWFFAFTLQAAAYVKAVGQVELVLSLIASLLFFGEKVSGRELLGMAVLCASILMLVLST